MRSKHQNGPKLMGFIKYGFWINMIKTWVGLFDPLFERSSYHIKGFSDFKRWKKVVKRGDFMSPQKWGVSKSLQKVKNRFFPF